MVSPEVKVAEVREVAEVKIEVAAIVELGNPRALAILKLLKGAATSIINMAQKPGHVLTVTSVQ